jgi:hypothetical protein
LLRIDEKKFSELLDLLFALLLLLSSKYLDKEKRGKYLNYTKTEKVVRGRVTNYS